MANTSGLSVTNQSGATITGGKGGAGGTGSTNGAAGVGGAGIVGANLTVTNSGTIAGGMSGATAGATQADAIDFTGGANSLNLSTGTLSGAVGVDGAGTTLDFVQGSAVRLANAIIGAGAVIDSGGGTLTLSGQNTYTGGTALNGGTLELGQETSAGTGAITFGTAGETLQIDATGTLGASFVTGFAANDAIDLAALNAVGAMASYANNVLTVSGTPAAGGAAASEAITIAAAPSGQEYAISADANGHALVRLAAIPTPTITAPANGTDTNNNTPTIAGTGESGDTVDLTIALQGGGTTTATAAVANGAWSYRPTSALTDGKYSVTAVETSPSGTGASGTSNTETFTVDTTAPTASSPTLTVAQNASPTLIGIAAPSDNLTATNGLAIVAGALPTDGTVTLNGTTPVTAGEALTAAQLTGLEFTPTPGLNNQGSTLTYTVTDGAGNRTTGTAALNIGSAAAPTITGTHATADQAEAPVMPFAGVTVADPSSAAGATETLTISLTGAGGALTGAGLTAGANGTYQLAGTAAQVTQALDALSFTPTAGAAGTTGTTAFVLTDASSAGTSVADSRTSVTDTTTAAPPPPPPPTPDTVSISPAVAYADGVFTLTGTASSPSGVGSVEISAVVDGVRQDLGAASVNPNGTFVFQDAALDQQSFFVATETDRTGGQATSVDPGFNLTGGLGPTGGLGKVEDFDAAGQVSTTLYRSNGTRFVGVEAANQTVDLQPFDIVGNHHEAGTSFVFSRGDGLDVIHGFQVGGAGHDTLELPSSDFTNLADVLRHTGDVNGSAFITDPKTGDAIRLAGVTTAELKAHPKDFAFG